MPTKQTALARVHVRDAMHPGILTTDPDTPLRVVARLMAAQRVHAVAVTDPADARRPWGIVSALDVAKGAAEDTDETAGQAASTEVVTVTADELLSQAAHLLVDHEVSHLVVIDPTTGHPCGILSTLDVAAAYAA